jgi:hypothetical protein
LSANGQRLRERGLGNAFLVRQGGIGRHGESPIEAPKLGTIGARDK